jgi:hypothetical protein
VHSFTSSSDERLPPVEWLRVFITALLIAVAFVAAMELRLAARGFRPSVPDSEALWLKQRARASRLGSEALILVGASRVQLDLDLEILHDLTGLKPVQLAIDGSTSLPIFEGLTRDPTITGTIIFDYYDHIIAQPEIHDIAARYQRDYEAHAKSEWTETDIEAWLSDNVHTRLRSYSDGASPFNSLVMRILSPRATPQYLITRPDRSRLADYTQVPMPQFYYGRVMRELGEKIQSLTGMTYVDVDRLLRQRIDRIEPQDNGRFLVETNVLRSDVETIRRRGGRVVFVRMPASALVWELEKRRYPRDSFWRPFSEKVGAPTISAEEYPTMAAFQCPDGSHLDFRDRERFTRALVDALKAKGVIGSK